MSVGKHVRLEQEGETLVVSPLFTFGRFTEGDLVGEWNCILQRISGEDVKHVVVDLGHIPYFGSTLLDWMVQMWKRIQVKGGTLAVCNPSQIGREVLGIARFDKLWGIFSSRQEALQSFTQA
jgi:anti-anti-sigma factor